MEAQPQNNIREVLALGHKYFPQSSDEEIIQTYQEILAKAPDITLDQIEKVLPLMAKQEQLQNSPQDRNLKLEALKGMRG